MSTYLHLVNTHIQVLTSVCALYEACSVCAYVSVHTRTKTNQIATNGRERGRVILPVSYTHLRTLSQSPKLPLRQHWQTAELSE